MKIFFTLVKKYFNLGEEFQNAIRNSGLREDELLNKKVEMNSKKVEFGDIFFAINSGNNYIEEVLEKKPFLVIADKKESRILDERVVYVEDTVETMQKLANLYRKEANFKVIGITGSNGKTTTKDILYYILSEKYLVKKTEGNYNNHIGLPFTILTTREETEMLILEMGMSDLGEIDLLCKIAEPNYGIITNIGLSHMEHLKTKENVFKAKTEMVKYLSEENLFIPYDDEFLRNVKGIHSGFHYTPTNDKEGYKISDFTENSEGMFFTIEYLKDNILVKESYHSVLNGDYNCLNILLTLGLVKRLGITRDEINSALNKVILTPMRFQKVQWEDIVCINDAYNASPLSMNASLEAFANIYSEKYKIVALGDMLELGSEEINYHKEVIKKALLLNIDKIFLFGPRMELAVKEIEDIEVTKGKIILIQDKVMISNEIKELIKNMDKNKVALLLKGSRGMAMENIILR